MVIKQETLSIIKDLILTFSTFLIVANGFGQVIISGKTELDSIWEKEIYVSTIPSLYDIYKSSNSLIIDSSKIEDDGSWQIELPSQKESQIIRLHVIKKGDPTATLIIGSKDENHGFIAIDKTDKIVYKNDNNKAIFSDFTCDGNDLNKRLTEITAIAKKWEVLDRNTSIEQQKIKIRKAAAKELLKYADTTTSILPAIYSAHIADFGFNRRQINSAMMKIRNRLGDHSYLNSYSIVDNKNSNFLIYLVILIGVIIGTWLFFHLYRLYSSHVKVKRLNSLSYREKEVFNLIKQGKTNKEIANELSIETSTVKSHVNSIYSKLNISSRKHLLSIKTRS